MSAFLFGLEPRYRAISATGAPIPGAYLQFYLTDTTTPTDPYTSSALTTPISTTKGAGTAEADSGGLFASIYLDSEITYRVQLYTAAGVLVWDVDPYEGLNLTQSAIGLTLYPRTAAEIAAGVTPTNYAYPPGNVFRYGAAGNGSTDDTAAIENGILVAQQSLGNLYFPAGVYKITSTIALDNNPITFISEPSSTLQQGSQRPSATLRWTGGASAMFDASSSGWGFVGFAIENTGTATCFLTSTASQYLHIEDCSFLVGSGASQFSIANFYATSNAFGYSTFRRTAFQCSAPAFIHIDGNGASNGVTKIEIDGGLFESNSLGDTIVFKLVDCLVTLLHIHDATFNQQQNELCIVDTTTTPTATSINTLVFDSNETDIVVASAADRKFKLTNVLTASIDNNFFSCGGTVTGMADLVNSTVSSFNNNYAKSIAGPFFDADASSRVVAGINAFVVASTQGVVNDDATASGVVELTYGTTVTLLGQYGQGTGPITYLINVTNGTGWTLSFAHPGIGSGGYFVRGQQISVMVKNTSGGAMGAITVSTTYFKMAGGAFPAPANGNSRTVTFVWNGAAFIELHRTAADIPN